MSLFDSIAAMIEKGISGITGTSRSEYRDSLAGELRDMEQELRSYCARQTGYIYTFSYRDLLDQCREIELRSEKELRLFRPFKGTSFHALQSNFDSFQAAGKQLIVDIEAHNRKYLKEKTEEAYRLIGSVEGRRLDEQQMACIVKDADSHLVVAGAGCGKTTTIIGKIKYLLAAGQAAPQEILVLSYTKASAEEMAGRLKRETGQNIWVATFHKLGLEIIKSTRRVSPTVYGKTVAAFIREDIRKRLDDQAYLADVAQYLLFHRVRTKSEFSFENEAEYREFLETNPPTTIREERVKSYGEMNIANFLTQHGIRYQYEAPYQFKTATAEYRQYHPDFYLPDYQIYIEYFGIDRNGGVPAYFSGKDGKSASETYMEGMIWKRALHREHGTRLIECYGYENMEGNLLEMLRNRLTDAGVQLGELSYDELFEKLGPKGRRMISTLAETMATVITLCKNRKLTPETLLEKCTQEAPSELALAKLTATLFDDYNRYLEQSNQIDFADMLVQAEELVVSGQFHHPFKYVIVDEYQDLSAAPYRLLQAMRSQSRFALFCVGDDWQSIYRFTGSDVGYTLQFDRYWGNTELSRIETTYRFSKGLIDISGQFIMENPNQIKKYLVSGNDSGGQVLGQIYGRNQADAVQALANTISGLPQNASVYLLGRYQFDRDMLKDCNAFQERYDQQSKKWRVVLSGRPDLNIVFLTVHGAKGLEADYVFILNTKSTYSGFPGKMQNAPLIEMLLEQADNYPDAEERRLFYVALTRAKKQVFLLTYGNKKYFSPFAQYLLERFPEAFSMRQVDSSRDSGGMATPRSDPWICPKCGGRLRKVSGPYGEFIGCTNYAKTGCRYKRKLRRIV